MLRATTETLSGRFSGIYFKTIMKKHFSLLASLPVAASLLLAVSTPIFAQTATNSTKISISPVTFNLTANAGDSLKEVIKVRNDAATAQNVTISAENFVAVGEEGTVGLTEDSTTYSLAKWINFGQTKYTLKSGEEVQVPFNVNVPLNAEPGGHYASVYAQVSPSTPGESSGSGVGQKIGSLVLLRVAGNVKESASVASFSAGKVEPGKPLDFDIRVQNNGSVHIRPQGFVTVTDLFGKKVVDVQVQDQNVFPGSIRHMVASWNKPPFIGRFTANLLMYYGQNNQQLTASTTFWVIPWTFLIVWGGVILVVIILIILLRRRIGRAIKALVSGK